MTVYVGAIDDEPPARGFSWRLGRLFGRSSPPWGTWRMVRDAQHFLAR